MQKLIDVWSGLDARRRLVAMLAAGAVLVTLIAMSRMAAAPQMALLYSGLDSASAGEVVQTLEAQAVTYEVRGDAIYADRGQRDTLRLTLAAAGLPANGAAGYELLDSLSGFGTTSQMFDAAYWRAKEGELARTIVASPYIRAARVHIANASGQPFRRDLKPTAAVTATTKSGALTPAQAKALKYLVASSVAGLLPDAVSVIDGESGLVVAGDAPAPAQAGTDRAESLRSNVERLLEARMGPGKAVVEVSVETETDRESISERVFDPDSRVAISTETEERTTSSTDQDGAAVTVASNLPEGDGAANRSASSNNSETSERVNYEVSETHREVLRNPGAIRRLSVAVLLDGVRGVDATGAATWVPLPDEEIEALKELVASAVGFDAQRGDVITVKSMPFVPVTQDGTLVQAGLIERLDLDLMTLAQIAILGIVGLLLGLFVLRPILAGRNASSLRTLPAPVAGTEPAPAARSGSQAGLTGEIDDGILPDVAVNSALLPAGEDRLDAAALPSTDPVARLRQLIEDRREESIEILRHWMEDERERT